MQDELDMFDVDKNPSTLDDNIKRVELRALEFDWIF